MSRDALVVGINTYDYQQFNLKTPAEDAEAIAQLLTEYGDFKVRRLPAIQKDGVIRVGRTTTVTQTQMEEALVQLFKPEGKNIPDTALFFFAGHGQRKNRGISEGFLATSNVNPNLENWGVRLKWLRELLQESPIRQQIIWLDCCNSGELLNFQESLKEADPGNLKNHDRCFITACREFEVAIEGISGNHGVLTAALLKGLDPNQRTDGWVTNNTLANFINQELKTATQLPLCHNSGSAILLTTNRAQKPGDSSQESVCPYKGLEYFKEEDANFFYGRTALTDELIEKVRTENFIAVLGASGSGKSSVLRAGLLYQLRLGQRLSGSDRWQFYQPFTPGEYPLQSLKDAIGKPRDELDQLIATTSSERVGRTPSCSRNRA